MRFNRLRLSGFKSFVDPTEFRIEPGLTGVVGPNGCGKSNILEGLRWVMGANSAKANAVIADFRGGETLGVNSTPTLFINGTQYRGSRSFEDLDGVLSKLVK